MRDYTETSPRRRPRPDSPDQCGKQPRAATWSLSKATENVKFKPNKKENEGAQRQLSVIEFRVQQKAVKFVEQTNGEDRAVPVYQALTQFDR